MDENKPTNELPSQPPVNPAPASAMPGPDGPILTKAVASMILGWLSIVSCFCFGFPAVILGPIAIWLGWWAHKNYRGNTASEFANVCAWIGIVLGCIGFIMGAIGIVMMLLGVGLSLLEPSNSRYTY